MSIERYLRLIAGFFVMLSVALGYWVNPAWFLFTAFRRPEPVSVGAHRLVPDDDVSSETGGWPFARRTRIPHTFSRINQSLKIARPRSTRQVM